MYSMCHPVIHLMNEGSGLKGVRGLPGRGTVIIDDIREMLNVVINDGDWMRMTFGELLSMMMSFR